MLGLIKPNEPVYLCCEYACHVCMVYVCSNEHIAIATHVVYFRKKACIKLGGVYFLPTGVL